MREALARVIIGYREGKLNVSLEELAMRAGVDYEIIERLENADIDPELSVLAKVASALGVSIGEMMTEVDSELKASA